MLGRSGSVGLPVRFALVGVVWYDYWTLVSLDNRGGLDMQGYDVASLLGTVLNLLGTIESMAEDNDLLDVATPKYQVTLKAMLANAYDAVSDSRKLVQNHIANA
jgi:hypothetical protein